MPLQPSWARALRSLVGASAFIAASAAADLVTTRPQTLHVGLPRGFATAADVDASRSRRALALPAAETAQIVWHRQLPGGVACNVLVDESGRAFVAGQGRVTQIGGDGALQFSTLAGFSGAMTAALLADGSRAVLTREGHVIAWSPAGNVVFDVALDAPTPLVSSTLLPLPDGGVLASVGTWLFAIDATRDLRSFVSLSAPIVRTLLSGTLALAVDDRGRVFEWDRRSAPRRIGVFSGPITAIVSEQTSLVALTGRSAERLEVASGARHELARFEAPGLAPLLALPAPGQPIAIEHDGTWLLLTGGMAARKIRGSPSDALTRIDLLADETGAVAWWAADEALVIETSAAQGRRLSDVRCASPASLVPAGRSKLIAACSSGAIWLVGPEAPAGAVR